MTGVETKNLTRRPVPRFAYTAVAETVLPGWTISLVFIGPKKAAALNLQLRGKSYVPNVLSYELGKRSGEIIICLQEAERQAPAHEMRSREFVLYLFIHGLLHLKGWAHGGTMEQCEQTLMAQFAKRTARTASYVTANSNRNRHRHLPSKSGSRRGAR